MKLINAFRSSLQVSAIAMAVAGSFGQAAYANVVSENDDASVGEIIVTANKIKQNVNDVGMSINAMTGDDLRKNDISSPDQLVKAVPGFTYTRAGYGQPVYTLRGVGFYDVVTGATPAVSVYVNEVPLPFPTMTRGAALDVQRLEVLKGPQGTLFGQNATGGAINYIPNQPTDELSAGLDASYSSFDKVTVGGFIGGPLSSTLKVRIAAAAENGGAWQKSISRPGDELGDSRFYNGRMLVDWTPFEGGKFQLNVNGWSDKSDEQAAQTLALVTPASSQSKPSYATLVSLFAAYPHNITDPRLADWDSGNIAGANDTLEGVTHKGFRRNNSFRQVALRGEFDLGNVGTLTTVTAWEKIKLSTLTDPDGLPVDNYAVSTGGRAEVFSQELRVNGQAGALRWMIGGNYEEDNVRNFGDIFSDRAHYSTFSVSASRSIAKTKTRTLAGFLNLDYAVTDTINLLGGIRYTDVRIRNDGCTIDGGDGRSILNSINLAQSVFGVTLTAADFPANKCVSLSSVPGSGYGRPLDNVHGELNENNVPWKLGVNWKVTPSSLVYFSVSRGYKAGTFSPVGAFIDTSLAPATQESVLAYEAGTKLGLLDRVVQLNGAVFYYDYSDKQTRSKFYEAALNTTLNKTINIPKAHIQGGELQLVVTPDDHWKFNASVSYTDSKILDKTHVYTFSSGATGLIDGQVLPLTPKWQAQADLEYEFGIGNDNSAFLGTHLYTQSEAYSGLGMEALFRNKGYTNLDLRAGVRGPDDKWGVTVFANNVTNTYSWNFVNLQGQDIAARLTNPPRIIGVRFSLRH